ncbi:Rox3-domain-containing protein [Thozetella sp. PMI_491]|nr:Rox3-domain-containing protein [Thozetella sp. PMI_491]
MSFHPQTPQSPSQFSPGSTDPSASMSSSMTSITTALPTPAHSVNGSSIPADMTHDVAMTDESPHKRKRPLEDVGDQEQKKVHIEESDSDIRNLHLDVGVKYLVCKTPRPAPIPDCTQDLFERYGLVDLKREVARVLPDGTKNALRKTYKGYIKRLNIAGQFDAVKLDENRPDGFLAMCKMPEQEWNVHHVRGQEMANGLLPDVIAKMAKAMTMGKGSIPKSRWDSSVLGDLVVGSKAEKQTSSARATAPNTPLAGATPLPRKPQGGVSAQEAARPQRSIKKRTYGDSSFEGYGEGFPDDDLGQDGGYSTGEGDRTGGQQKKRKKSHPGQPYPQVRTPSYGPGMVGA